ncbi:MAG: 30S ribosomal protein S18 [Thermodesulfobacteriaceae bacterium]|nr:30S ribosomal protein S18 [Thermodesulfobacteriaceae bacterium]MCX8042311.1 30S ribosomal protein S18 [Thermodesulfobacteriaceae bacterium]MDW8135605.1 30S ribosomal protein S18 [Thermodesulfobacterium sp.]
MDNPVIVKKRVFPRKKVCKFCSDPNLIIDYKNHEVLKTFLNEKGMILHRRQTGTCAYHQRRLTNAIKMARIMALLPFVADVEID